MISGTAGYDKSVERFVEISRKLNFEVVNRDFLPYLPTQPARVLDLGCGVGQNAAALAERGHSVVALEPMREFLAKARESYGHLPIQWQRGSMPLMACLGEAAASFDFILVNGVWHHLSLVQRDVALCRISDILAPGGRCAISLRNGPPGIGKCVFPTDVTTVLQQAHQLGLSCRMKIENQPSLLAGKTSVSWTRVLLEKTT